MLAVLGQTNRMWHVVSHIPVWKEAPICASDGVISVCLVSDVPYYGETQGLPSRRPERRVDVNRLETRT